MISNCCNIYDHIDPLLGPAPARDTLASILFWRGFLPYIILFGFTLDRTIFL
jgi:hypothetical protein